MLRMSDSLMVAELNLAGGTWAGLLFDNPGNAVAPRLTWTFTFNYREVSRDYGDAEPNLVIDWVPLPGSSWRNMTGQHASGSTFGDPIESSVYFFEHHRFDRAELRVDEQRGNLLHVAATLDGDIDDLGLAAITAEGWLAFAGVTVALSGLEPPVDRAQARLAEFTDATGLVGSWTGRNFHFAPTA